MSMKERLIENIIKLTIVILGLMSIPILGFTIRVIWDLLKLGWSISIFK